MLRFLMRAFHGEQGGLSVDEFCVGLIRPTAGILTVCNRQEAPVRNGFPLDRWLTYGLPGQRTTGRYGTLRAGQCSRAVPCQAVSAEIMYTQETLYRLSRLFLYF